MKHFMIKYQFANGTPEEWHREIGRFITALDNDPELKGRIIYRCMKNRDNSSYWHLASPPTSWRSRRCSSGTSSSIIPRRPGRSPAASHGHADRTDRRNCGSLSASLAAAISSAPQPSGRG